jgi:hypothetical protein
MKNRSLFIALTLIFSLPLCAQLKKHQPNKLVLKKSAFGTYGYKEVGKDSWVFIPRFKYAEPLPYEESCAAFSIDGEKYGIINSLQCVLAKPIFDRPPYNISCGIAIIDTDNGQQLTDFDGKRLSPEVYKILRYETTFAIQRTKNDAWQFVDAKFNPITTDSYKSIIRNTLYCDSVSAHVALTESREGLKGLHRFDGKAILDCNYKLIDQLSHVYEVNYYFEKAVNKSSVSRSSLQPFALVENANGSYGVIDYLTNSQIAVKGKNYFSAIKSLCKMFKKQIAPLCTNEKKSKFRNLLVSINQASDSLTDINVKALGGQGYFDCIWTCKIASYDIKEFVDKPTARNKKTRSRGGKAQKYYRFENGLGMGSEKDTRVFTMLEDIGGVKKGTERGTKGECLYDYQGFKIGNGKPYEEIDVWGYFDGVPWIKFKENGKWGLMTVGGDIVQDAIYDKFDYYKEGLSAAYLGDRLYLINSSTGRLVNDNSYDADECFIYKEVANVKRNGYNVKVYPDGHENPSVARIVFNEFYGVVENNPNAYTDEEKLKKYDAIINMCSTGDNDVAGACYNNMGVIYHKAGNLSTALRLFAKAKGYGVSNASQNIAIVESQMKQERRAAWGQALSGIGNILGSVSGNTSYDLNNNINSYSGSGSDNYNSNTGGGASASTYQNIYDRWERTAKSAYESLTRAGTRNKQNGKDVSGSNGGYWNSQNYVGLKQNLRNAQSEMRKTRQEARRKGININQSNYETITVSY